jgi:hypothetical protein
MYKLSKLYYGQQTSVIRTTDGACIPFDPDNTDYQAYLKWVEAGNTPQAADAATEPADEQGA